MHIKRITRPYLWLALGIVMLIDMFWPDLTFLVIAALICLIYTMIGRIHDLDYNGFYLLAIILPLVNFYIAFLLLFKRGTIGPNEYGIDPLCPDYIKPLEEICTEQSKSASDDKKGILTKSWFISMFGLDKIKKQVDDYNRRREEIKKLCGEPFLETILEVMYVDKINHRFYFDSLTNEKFYVSFDFSKYMGADIVVNETIINERHTSISGAVLGGLLFGTAGAIIGGSNGKITQETKIENIKIVFSFDDYEHPIIEMNQPIDKHSYSQRIWVDKIKEMNEKVAQIEYLVRHCAHRDLNT